MMALPLLQCGRRGCALLLSSLLWLIAPAAAQADAAAGQQKAQVCTACHGEGGNSLQSAVPSLAGQPKQFLVSALFQFREGKRVNALMSPMAANLSNADLNDLAAYFSALKPRPPTQTPAAQRVAQGKAIAQFNNCTACHAATLAGQQHIPRLAGQQREYLAAQLTAFRASTRAEMDGVMTSAAQGLTPDDIEILADYLAGLDTP